MRRRLCLQRGMNRRGLDATSVTDGKQMEAIREGVEDYEYLRMLRDRIDELARKGAGAAVLDPARKLLVDGPARVTACMKSSAACNWTVGKDRAVADEVRVEILRMLVELTDK